MSRYESQPDSRSRAGSAGSSTQGSPVMGRSTVTTPPLTPGESKRNPFNLNLKDLPTPHFHKSGHSPSGHSPRKEIGEYFVRETEEEQDRKAWEKEKRRRRKAKAKRKEQERFITQHVAAILERQQFIMKLARAFMMFGAPSHRLEAQMQATARVLEINGQVIYIPGVMLISFGDSATHTSDIKVRSSSLALFLPAPTVPLTLARPSQTAVLEAGQRPRPRQAPDGVPRLLQRPARPRLGHRRVEGAR